jgi:hypothetical protein
VWGHHLPCIEIHGTEGSLSVPDPNTFGGPVRIYRPGMKEWEEVPVTRPYAENSRGIGVADMACSIRSGRPQRASGELTYHVLDLMHAFHDSSRLGRHVMVMSTVERPAPLPLGLKREILDDPNEAKHFDGEVRTLELGRHRAERRALNTGERKHFATG